MSVKVMFHHEDTGNCQTTFKEVCRARYFNRVEHGDFGCWYTVYPFQGYWENSSEVKNDVVFEVVDFDGNLLFTESNGNIGAFYSIGRKAKEVAAELAEKLSLRSHEEWHYWLSRDMVICKYKDYVENWLYAEPEARGWETIGRYQHLGIRFAIITGDMIHPSSGKKWRVVYIENQRSGNCEEICEYVLGLEIGFIPGEEFAATCKQLGCIRYRFIGVEPGVSSFGEVHLLNLDDNTDTYVEPAWFRNREIERRLPSV